MNNEISNEVLKELIRRQPNDTFGLAMAELLANREAATPALNDVIAERQRQISAEGWTPQHDDEYEHGEIAGAASCYAKHVNARGWVFREGDQEDYQNEDVPDYWPWADDW